MNDMLSWSWNNEIEFIDNLGTGKHSRNILGSTRLELLKKYREAFNNRVKFNSWQVEEIKQIKNHVENLINAYI